jgi:hypothetical protein
MVRSLVVLAAAALLQQPACDSLKTLSLPRATITAVDTVAAGGQAPGRGRGAAAPLPAHCRVAVTLTPSADSHVEMELWLRKETARTGSSVTARF